MDKEKILIYKFIKLCACVTVAGIFSALTCACNVQNEANDNADVYKSQVATLGIVQPVEFEHHDVQPHIAVDITGYRTESKKIFYVFAEANAEFEVINSVNGKSVYSGTLVPMSADTGNTTDNEPKIYIGNFSDFRSNGSYRIYNRTVGYSYEFRINNNIYDKSFDELYFKEKRLIADDCEERDYRLAVLMLMKELFPDSYFDRAYVRGQIEEVLAEAEIKVEELYENDKQSLVDVCRDSAILAQYYNFCRNDDLELADKCRKMSINLYAGIAKYRDSIEADSWYWASAELYRATGNYAYRNAISEYDKYKGDSEERIITDFSFLADMTYLMTEYRTEYERCRQIMDTYMQKASDISQNNGKGAYYVREDIETVDVREALHDMMVLEIANYVLSCNEYTTVVENYIHYYSGRNAKLKDYMGEIISSEDSDIKTITDLLFVLAPWQ